MKLFKIFLTLFALLLVGNFVAGDAHSQCCVGDRGNIDGDSENIVDISDLVFMVDYQFRNGDAPPCFEEADIAPYNPAEGKYPDEIIDIADLVYMVDYQFRNGDAPPACPEAALNIVFQDDYGFEVTYEAFAGSKLDAVQTTTVETYAGSQGLEITIPDAGDPSGSYSGGAFTTTVPRDLTTYNCVSFYAKASVTATLDVAGLGNDNTGTSIYTAEMTALPLSTSWQKYIIPIPLAAKLSGEAGLFYFAEGPEGGVGYTIWIDEIVFENLGTITNPRAAYADATIDVNVGETVAPGNGLATFDVGGTDQNVSAMPAYFTFNSSNESAVTVVGDVISAVGEGTSNLTAMLGAVAATGTITVNVAPPEAIPTTPAPTPTPDPADVISLFSDVYTDVTVDTWSAGWDVADVADYAIGSDNTKKYTNLSYAGIEFTSNTIDASAMTHFHMDVWTPDNTASPAVFKVKLVDFGADGVWSGSGTDDVEVELTFDENTMASETWVSIDVPLASFAGLTTGHLAQMVISGDPNTVYVDNIYFYDSGLPTEPLVAAPTPTVDAGSVVSLYSDAYTSATIDTWSAVWDQADVSDFVVASDNTKKYTNLNYAGIEFLSLPVDASAMTYFHMDVWTPIPTDAPALFKVKLVDAGADGTLDGNGDVEQELSFDETVMNTGEWVSIDIPLADFTNLVTTGHLVQMIISGDLGTVFVDNIYFYNPIPTEPTTSAPTPSQDPGDVFSVFSDAYTSVDFDTWSSMWDDADVADFTIGSDNIKKYYNMPFSIAEYTTSGAQDISAMTHFHIDIWTPDATSAPNVFNVKLVDYGANGTYDGGGDDTESELSFDEATMNTGEWVSLDIPLSNFTGYSNTGHFAQMILSGDLGTVFVDNVYFYTAGAPTAPTTSPATPSQDPGDVISLFSNSYTDITIDTWSAAWDNADVSDYSVGSDDMKFYTLVDPWYFAGIEYWAGGTLDASGMTHFHMDVWTPDNTDAPNVFKVKLVDAGADGDITVTGDNSEYELSVDNTTMATGSWVSIDVPLTSFPGMNFDHLAQLILAGDIDNFYVDNIYFYYTAPSVPTVSAPTPSQDAGNVISVFSDHFTGTDFSTWSSEWDDCTVSDFTVGSDNMKYYSNLVFSIAEYTGMTVDLSSMTHFHMDVWTPNETASPNDFKVKLVDWGADGVWSNGGDDVEGELTFDHTVMSSGTWVSLDISLADFATAGMATKAHFSQMILSGTLSDVYVDNVYFYEEIPSAPTTSAPTPTHSSADVISVFSDAYTSTDFSTWSSEWDNCTVADYTIGSDNLKQYTDLVFSIAEYVGSTVDLSTMTHFHMDVWTPDATTGTPQFGVKLVDWGADGVWSNGGDDVEGELLFGESTMNTGSWVSLDIPLADFATAGMSTKAHFAQLILSGDLSTVFVDNVYFHK